jgi:hypothetical protein
MPLLTGQQLVGQRVIVEADGVVPSGVSGPKSSLRNLGWHFLPAARGRELRVAAGPEVRQVLADAGRDWLVTVFGSLAEALPNREPPLEPRLPGMAPAWSLLGGCGGMLARRARCARPSTEALGRWQAQCDPARRI